MEQKFWAVPRRAFCWLDEKNVIVISKDDENNNGDCELLNTVSSVLTVFCFSVFFW